MTQKTIKIRRLQFDSFLKLAFLTGLSSGVFMGIFMFVSGLLGGSVTATVGTIRLTGFHAGLVNLVLAPALTSFMFVLLALVAYLPLKLSLIIFKNISFTALIDVIEAIESTEEQLKTQEQLPHENHPID